MKYAGRRNSAATVFVCRAKVVCERKVDLGIVKSLYCVVPRMQLRLPDPHSLTIRCYIDNDEDTRKINEKEFRVLFGKTTFAVK